MVTIALRGPKPDWTWTAPEGWRPVATVYAAAIASTSEDYGSRLCVTPAGEVSIMGATSRAWGAITYIRA